MKKNHDIVKKIIKRGISGYLPYGEATLAYLFHENTKLTPLKSREYGEYIQQITSISYFVERMRLAYKHYYFADKIALSIPTELGISICEVIKKRRSVRQFNGMPISLKDIATLLFYSYGITGEIPIPGHTEYVQRLRAIPSAGALYPLEIYIVVFKSNDIAQGLYHFNVDNFCLELLKTGDFSNVINELCFLEPYIAINTANCCIIITAMFERTILKYQDRGYRFILMEAGHLGQNISLVAVALSLGTVCIGGFLDDYLNKFLEIDPQNESVIYPIIVGGTEPDYGEENHSKDTKSF